jgi:hypothetical protein
MFGEFCAREEFYVSTNKISEKMNEYNEHKNLSIAYITKPLAVSRVVGHQPGTCRCEPNVTPAGSRRIGI